MKKKLNNKLSLKKETISELNKKEMNLLKGGTGQTYDANLCTGTCTVAQGETCWCSASCANQSVCTCQ